MYDIKNLCISTNILENVFFSRSVQQNLAQFN